MTTYLKSYQVSMHPVEHIYYAVDEDAKCIMLPERKYGELHGASTWELKTKFQDGHHTHYKKIRSFDLMYGIAMPEPIDWETAIVHSRSARMLCPPILCGLVVWVPRAMYGDGHNTLADVLNVTVYYNLETWDQRARRSW